MEKICDRCKKSKPKEIFKRYKNCPECLLVINKDIKILIKELEILFIEKRINKK